jgi:N-acetylglucosaminyldiphosphoundecaprenol N-acetyl-beta-D-mannosaminyltransferase
VSSARIDSAHAPSKKINLFGVAIDNVSMAEAVSLIDQMAGLATPSMVVTPNVDHVMRLQGNRDFQDVYSRAALVLADGAPLVWASHLLGTPLKAKVSGSDLFVQVCAMAEARGHGVYLLGGEPNAASISADRLRAKFPALKIVGHYCPPFGFERDLTQNSEILSRIRQSHARILFVGLGSPKQEEWLDQHLAQSGCGVGIGVGVSFSFQAGLVRRAPRWMQTIGLEWSWRLAMEPRRLWRRYLVDDLPFLLLLIKAWWRKARVKQ